MSDQTGYKEVLENLRRYLQHWDPVGVIPNLIKDGHAPSEYDSYAGPLYTLLASGASEEKVEEHLKQCLKYMGLHYVEKRDRAMAKSLHTYFKNSGF
ncbi:hypothetical protein [Bdellovibrio sp. NC01]|uniref:hypothetical protein n=1 Tax=Bdellovibrio sp. NC01 TaxID=2220073 RepID=UPI00115BB42C|nr:hypothetical protein [Bdellovibrio sp. NC01]QDK37973.1 hypothetical protein DOE51_10420 [Bdellovibrio sp. NC01]